MCLSSASLRPQISNDGVCALTGTTIYVITYPLNANCTEEDLCGIFNTDFEILSDSMMLRSPSFHQRVLNFWTHIKHCFSSSNFSNSIFPLYHDNPSESQKGLSSEFVEPSCLLIIWNKCPRLNLRRGKLSVVGMAFWSSDNLRFTDLGLIRADGEDGRRRNIHMFLSLFIYVYMYVSISLSIIYLSI